MWLNFKPVQNGLTALHLSSKEGNVDIVKVQVDIIVARNNSWTKDPQPKLKRNC